MNHACKSIAAMIVTALLLQFSLPLFANEAADSLLAQLKPINNLSASFQQQTFDKNTKPLQQQNGHFVVKKSGEFRWSVNAPYEQLIVSDGKTLHIYDPDLEQLTIKKADTKVQMVPLLLFSHNADEILSQYDISLVNTEATSVNNRVYELSPKQSGNLFEGLRIVFSSGTPKQLEITDSLKQVTRVEFGAVMLNKSLMQDDFQFVVPEGIDIIDER